ncbi:uncharacterized protein LOC110815394 [Carica papaya]|uniref:uncharacterized protein LOC110815394 n=1 Tax=Carica papaya TaxID=3649 RepID=UPI000B8CFC90|nr:uncharacterized protein LOC110815394 [Carica papaya]
MIIRGVLKVLDEVLPFSSLSSKEVDFRSLSRQDIQLLVGYGCPSTDKKVVFSAKLLRKHVHLDEGDVCSSCSLRTSCEKGYLLTNKEDEARTIDVMRVLLTYGFDPLDGSLVNKSVLKQKSVKNVVRKLLHEVVKLSSVPIDPNLPPPVIKKPPPKVKQPPPPPKKRVGRDDVEMKKGDWLCPKCDFMNFAKNTVCLQCDAKRPKRQLLPGEWECPECNFLNYRRNVTCFHCDCKRPPDELVETKTLEKQHGLNMGLKKVGSRHEVSNAWNFDFDDNESDGADVAAFEYADSSVMGEDIPLDSKARQTNFKGPEDEFSGAKGVPRSSRREYAAPDHGRPGTGFDDFDEDDVDSYEIDTQKQPVRKFSSNDFSEVEGFSESEDSEMSNSNSFAHRRTPSSNKTTKYVQRRQAFSGSENDELSSDSDEEISVHPNWKSSHIADSRHRDRGRGPKRGLSFGSDEELGVDSDIDDNLGRDFGDRQRKGRGNFKSTRSSGSFSGSVSDSDDDLHSWRNKSAGNKVRNRGKGKSFNDGGFGRITQARSKGRTNTRRIHWMMITMQYLGGLG